LAESFSGLTVKKDFCNQQSINLFIAWIGNSDFLTDTNHQRKLCAQEIFIM